MATKYKLTDTQVRHLAIICYREQGSNDAGVRACASHMCNYYEKYQQKNFKDVYECTFGSGWYWSKAKNEKWVADHPDVPQSVVKAVKDVICNGNRSLPEYVDEYDCLGDVKTATNNGKSFNPKDRKQYKKDVTKIVNAYGSAYTFYCFPDGADGYCDAFGYINKAMPQKPETKASEGVSDVKVSDILKESITTVKAPEIRSGSVGSAVSVLQGLLDMMGYRGRNGDLLDIDGEFGSNTEYALKTYQKAAGLAPDGVCGKSTWNKLKRGING